MKLGLLGGYGGRTVQIPMDRIRHETRSLLHN